MPLSPAPTWCNKSKQGAAGKIGRRVGSRGEFCLTALELHMIFLQDRKLNPNNLPLDTRATLGNLNVASGAEYQYR